MGKSRMTNLFVCPCEENEIHYEEDDFEPTYCPWCGDSIEELKLQDEDLYNEEVWDEVETEQF